MSHFGLKINKSESPDKTPYTTYYPHTIPHTERRWNQPYIQFVSIDPAQKNYALRIERRYHNGWITPIVFDKVSVKAVGQEGTTTTCNTYQKITEFLSKYEKFYPDCNYIIIERQLPQNYQAVRISQHSISYFSIKLHNAALLPSIVEVDPKLKGRMLGAPKGISDKQLKSWAVEKGRELFTIRRDTFSLDVLNHFSTKQDDLCDTVCQIEAICMCWGIPITSAPPNVEPNKIPLLQIKPITLEFAPPKDMDELPYNGSSQLVVHTPQSSSSSTQQLSDFISTSQPSRPIRLAINGPQTASTIPTVPTVPTSFPYSTPVITTKTSTIPTPAKLIILSK